LEGHTVLLKMVAHSLAFAVLLGLLLFLPAGTMAWPQAWVFMALFIGCSEAIGVWLAKSDPDLLVERTRSPLSADQKLKDRAVVGAIIVVFFGWIIFMAFDARRFGWSHTSWWAQALGAALIVGAFYGWVGVLKTNSFASTTLRVQEERGQTVISTGPYAAVRHPMYAHSLLVFIGTPLLLGSLWGLWGVVLFIPLLAARVLGEEAMLMDGLPGYREYAAKVRFRLLPGVW
jgi:protein-S-isoprenylcysteine O-methyltransferase Ste14